MLNPRESSFAPIGTPGLYPCSDRQGAIALPVGELPTGLEGLVLDGAFIAAPGTDFRGVMVGQRDDDDHDEEEHDPDPDGDQPHDPDDDDDDDDDFDDDDDDDDDEAEAEADDAPTWE
jgi:hypothetical protein